MDSIIQRDGSYCYLCGRSDQPLICKDMQKGYNMQEIWKPIKNLEGLYEVSNFGNVRSVDRVIEQENSHGTGIMKRKLKGEMIHPFDNGHGYLVVNLPNGCKRKNHYVHRLVADAFLGEPLKGQVINHKDYNTRNNDVRNLEWCTQKENVAHSIEHYRKRKNADRTNTGHRYIYYCTTTRYKKKYRVVVDRKEIGRYETLEEAIEVRNRAMEGGD